MKLNINNLNNKSFWENANIEIPKYDINKVRENTKENPAWIHFGAGNIFRGFLARISDSLLNDNLIDKGIIAVDTHSTGKTNDYDMLEKVYKPFDNLTLLALIKNNGDIDKKVIGSVADILHADFVNYYEHLRKIFISNSLQIASFTITEKGYSIKDLSEKDLNFEKDISNIMAMITKLLFERYKNGAYPISMLSIDNCANNGDKLKESIITIAGEWLKKCFVEEGFIKYLEDKNKVSFPLSMIDKITPRPSDIISAKLKELGLEGSETFKVGNNMSAFFVNAEVPEYLVIEDNFTNGRPPFERAGVFMTDRITVQNSERMKVTVCLNPLHTALAIFGCIFNYNYIYEEMKNPLLKKLIEKLGYDEGMKVVVNPKIINPENFIKEVIEERFTNPFIPDSPQRIACDTSQKIPVRFGETLKSYIEKNLDTSNLTAIPITIAAWLRYLTGIDDNGNEMNISPDPMLKELQLHISKIKFKDIESVKNNLQPILSNKNIFLVDLYEPNINLGKRIENYFKEMINNVGAVNECLNKYIGLDR